MYDTAPRTAAPLLKIEKQAENTLYIFIFYIIYILYKIYIIRAFFFPKIQNSKRCAVRGAPFRILQK